MRQFFSVTRTRLYSRLAVIEGKPLILINKLIIKDAGKVMRPPSLHGSPSVGTYPVFYSLMFRLCEQSFEAT